jgi:hypothetical protein
MRDRKWAPVLFARLASLAWQMLAIDVRQGEAIALANRIERIRHENEQLTEVQMTLDL